MFNAINLPLSPSSHCLARGIGRWRADPNDFLWGRGGEQAFRETRVVSPVLCDCNKVLHLDLCPVSSWERGGGRGLGVQEERGCQERTQGMNLSAYFSLLGLSQPVPQTGRLSNRILLAPSSGGRENKIKGLGAVSS